MDTQNVDLTRANINQTYVFPVGFNYHSVLIQSLGDFPDTWNFLGYALKFQYYSANLVCLESKKLYLEFPTLLNRWGQGDNWYLGIKLHYWLWKNKNVLELNDPTPIAVSWFSTPQATLDGEEY